MWVCENSWHFNDVISGTRIPLYLNYVHFYGIIWNKRDKIGYSQKSVVLYHPSFLFVVISHSQCERPHCPSSSSLQLLLTEIPSITKTISLLLFADMVDHKIHSSSIFLWDPERVTAGCPNNSWWKCWSGPYSSWGKHYSDRGAQVTGPED